jgi:hypothetical protein
MPGPIRVAVEGVEDKHHAEWVIGRLECPVTPFWMRGP